MSNYHKGFENPEQFLLNTINQEIQKISSFNANSKLIVEYWYKLSEKNSGYHKTSLKVYRNWLFHHQLDNPQAVKWCVDLMSLGITDTNFIRIFIDPLIQDIEQLFNYKFNSYIEKSYFLDDLYSHLISHKIKPKPTSTEYRQFIKKFKDDENEIIDLIKRKESLPQNHDLEFKIIGSITPVLVEKDSFKDLWIVHSCFYDQPTMDKGKKIIMTIPDVRDYFFYKKLYNFIDIRFNEIDSSAITLHLGSLYVNLLNRLVNNQIHYIEEYHFMQEQLLWNQQQPPYLALTPLTFIKNKPKINRIIE